MTSIELDANAKINLSLDVLNKRADGYHELRMIMQSIGLHDTVSVEKTTGSVEVMCDREYVPSGEGNIAYKAAQIILEKFGIKSGLKIKIKKMIPVAAGLAGGSSDAAAVLRSINQLFELGLGENGLRNAGRSVGADVPFCIAGGTMLAEGIGEILTRLEPFKDINIVLLKPRIGVSTAWVYKNLNLEKLGERPDTEHLKDALSKHDIDAVALNMKNVLESVTIPGFPVVKRAKERLIELGAAGSMMSGSGPTVFGLFRDHASAYEAYKRASADPGWESFITSTI